MNREQRKVLIATLIVVLLMVLFPPWHAVVRGSDINLHHAWLFNPPIYPPQPYTGYPELTLARIDVPILMAQIVVALVVAALAWLVFKDWDVRQATQELKIKVMNSAAVRKGKFFSREKIAELLEGAIALYVKPWFPELLFGLILLLVFLGAYLVAKNFGIQW